MDPSTSSNNDKNTDIKEPQKPFFNRRKVVVPFFLVGGLVLLPAGFYGLYCYFNSATTFFNLMPNCLLAVHSNILTNIFTPCIAGFLEVAGVLCFLSFVARCISWHKKYFEFSKITLRHEPLYFLPDALNGVELHAPFMIRILARLSGLVPYDDVAYTNTLAYPCGETSGETEEETSEETSKETSGETEEETSKKTSEKTFRDE